MMRILVITDVPFTATEPAAIRQLLDEGVERVHLRKPDASEEALRRLIEALPAESYPRLTLQDRLPLAVEYGLGGVHLNRRNAAVPAGFRGLVSRSCHTLDEIAAHPACDYLFLSPLFDSISKSGYRAAFTVHYGLANPDENPYILDRVPIFGCNSHQFLRFRLRLEYAPIFAPLDALSRDLVKNGHTLLARFVPTP